ncbi:hypothetical protein RHMOL_Rhmol03G0286500 [Rhododendron molle]|uniref:Uncharacterized protein n=1 Tax=Rhododendron molle TaxID=49168 RepID=A0ACC0PKT3_RHOML|nr:hypothetical protein RHMOL_Rhmol03G0286500 [Rhododendron molle]
MVNALGSVPGSCGMHILSFFITMYCDINTYIDSSDKETKRELFVKGRGGGGDRNIRDGERDMAGVYETKVGEDNGRARAKRDFYGCDLCVIRGEVDYKEGQGDESDEMGVEMGIWGAFWRYRTGARKVDDQAVVGDCGWRRLVISGMEGCTYI